MESRNEIWTESLMKATAPALREACNSLSNAGRADLAKELEHTFRMTWEEAMEFPAAEMNHPEDKPMLEDSLKSLTEFVKQAGKAGMAELKDLSPETDGSIMAFWGHKDTRMVGSFEKPGKMGVAMGKGHRNANEEPRYAEGTEGQIAREIETFLSSTRVREIADNKQQAGGVPTYSPTQTAPGIAAKGI